MTLAQVTRLDASKYAREKDELQTRISELERLLSDRKALILLLKKEMQQLIKQFGDERRTTIDVDGLVHGPITTVEQLHEREPLTIAFTRAGTLKALPADAYKPKGKNGDAAYAPARGDEQLHRIIATTSQDYLLCVCSTGRVFQIATHRIPEGTRSAKGESLRKLLELAAGEEVVAIVPVETYDDDRYLVTFSKLGKVKKSPLSEYKTADIDGIQDMKLAEGDSVVAALLSRGHGEYFVTTSSAQTLRFSDEMLRSQGRVGQGVAAIASGKGAAVVSASYLDNEHANGSPEFVSLLVVTENGIAKKVPISQYPQKGRATAGVVTTELDAGDQILATMLMSEGDSLLVVWGGKNGEKSEQVRTVRATELKAFSRARKGTPLVDGRMVSIVKLP
jgi:DNA gyrase subunit A